MSDGNNVKRYDPRLNVFRQVPLSATPLSTFLARNVRLDQGVRIDRVTRMQYGGLCHHRPGRAPPQRGARSSWPSPARPMRLQEWTIRDAQGGQHPHPADPLTPRLESGRQPVPAARSDPAPAPQLSSRQLA